MNKVFLKKTKTAVLIAVLYITTGNVNASIIPNISIPDQEILEILESGPSWFPKPYKMPIKQGTLIKNESLQQLVPGLSKKQVEFLLGTPTIIDTFHTERWDYIYYERIKGVFSQPKRITVIFRNEKVAEIYDQYKIIKKMGTNITTLYENAPIKTITSKKDNLYQEVIIAKRDDYLTAT